MSLRFRMPVSARFLTLLLWAALCVITLADEDIITPQLAVVAMDISGDVAVVEDEAETKGPIVRCRMCGARIAHKHDHMELPDDAKSISSRYAHELSGDIHTFVNPSRIEMELVAFKKAVGVEGEAFTSKATFFEGYSWKDLRCGGCNRHVGWKFHHDDFQACIHSNIMETISAKGKDKSKSALEDARAKKKELVRKALEGECVVANAGWWSYEVCYGKEVRQFHEEQDGTRPSDWSMGVFVSDGKKLEHLDATADTGTEIAQYFAGGQHCDENGELRSTKVVYTCCKSNPATFTIDNVEEPSLCSYLITVCVPSLCDTKPRQPETPYSNKGLIDKCTAEFTQTHDDVSELATFAALRWSTVISEDSSELEWARSLDFKT